MKIAIVGTQGIPNTYGGFETLAEYLVMHLSSEFDITVYCSSPDNKTDISNYLGAKLRYLPLSSHGSIGMLYDSISLIDAVVRYDKVLFLGFGAGFVAPLLKPFKDKIILNFGGLDWQRDKWSPKAQWVIKKCEQFLVRNSKVVIADNKGIQDYIIREYNINTPLIAYGGDQAQKRSIDENRLHAYPFLKSDFAFCVTRIQPDNNIVMILEAMKEVEMPMVMVGNWKSSEFGVKTQKKYGCYPNLYLLDAIYDRNILDELRSNCKIYIHGHSAGGTNPSLVEAMYLGLPILAFSSGYNEYTTHNKAIYFKNSNDLTQKVRNLDSLDLDKIGIKMKEIAKNDYIWSKIAQQYKDIINK